MPSPHRNLRILTAVLFVAALVPRLMDRGMFVDGVTYAAIARNLAQGRGSFWQPFYTATVYPAFHEQPPLGLWLQSLWFRVLGDHLFVERLYAVTIAATTALIVAVLWRRLHWSSASRELDWLPIVLWIASPLVSWVIVGNMLENTLAVFTTAAVAVLLGATTPGARAGLVSGLCVVAAFLTKGPLGLFPLATPLILLLLIRHDGASWRALAAQWTTVGLCALVLLGMAASRDSLTAYTNQAVIAAVTGSRETAPSLFTIVKALWQGVLLPLGVGVGILVASARRWIAPSALERRWAAALMAVGLSGTLPIMISRKQTGHYLVPAVAFFALGAASYVAPMALAAVERLGVAARTKTIMAAAAVAVVASLAVGNLHWFARDTVMMAALDDIQRFVPAGGTIGICADARAEWGLHAWVQRRFTASLDADPGRRHELFLQVPNHGACAPSACPPLSNPSSPLVVRGCR